MSTIYHRIKNWLVEQKGWITLWAIAVVLVLLSFGLGYLLGKSDNPAPIIIEKHSN